MDIINKINISNDITLTEDSILFFHKPSKLDALPVIEPNVNNMYLKVTTTEQIHDYFVSILNDGSIVEINGIDVSRNAHKNHCNYCHELEYEIDNFYCYHCNKHMCNVCYTNKGTQCNDNNTHQCSIINRELLKKCHSYNNIHKLNLNDVITPYDGRLCDNCDKIINAEDNFYSVRRIDCFNTYDICLKCYNKNNEKIEKDVKKKYKNNIVKHETMKLIDVNDKTNYLFNYTGLGSMLYWFPIISDRNDVNHVLINLNPEHINYNKICLQCCDNHGRLGYFIIQNDTYNLEKVLQRLQEISNTGMYEYIELEQVNKGIENEEPKFQWITKQVEGDYFNDPYFSPIETLMLELNIPTYFG